MINAITDLGKHYEQKNPELETLDTVLDDAYEITTFVVPERENFCIFT